MLRPLVLLLLAAPAALAADDAPPSCSSQRAGQVMCMVNRLCECRYDQGGTMTGRPSGWRWDCGILRPDCAPAPASIGAPPMAPLPPVILQQRGGQGYGVR